MNNFFKFCTLIIALITSNSALADRNDCDMDSGPHPYDNRAFITAREFVYPGGDVVTEFTYMHLPENVSEFVKPEQKILVKIEETRSLTFLGADIATSRKMLASDTRYYEALIGMKASAGDFSKDVDKYLGCTKPSANEADQRMAKSFAYIAEKLALKNKKWADQLRLDQAAWVAYRQSSCELEANMSGKEKSGENFYDSCFIRLTKERRNMLGSIYSLIPK